MSAKRTILILSLIILITSTAACALTWDPDADADLKFNMNFESHTAYTTTDTKAGIVGTLTNCNPDPGWDPNNFFWRAANAIRGNISADFCQANDAGEGAINDVHLVLGILGATQPERACFELGLADSDERSFSFWFNTPSLVEGTLFRYVSRYLVQYGTYQNIWWEIRINNDRLEFRHGEGHIFIHTEKPLSELGRAGVPDGNGYVRPDSNGCDPNTWHHAVIVLDRTSKYGSKIYIDGVEAAINVISYKAGADSTIDSDYRSCAYIGGGKKLGDLLDGYEFDGMLDDIRVYHRDLSPGEANILYQWDSDDPNAALAIVPWVNEKNAAMNTDLEWEPSGDAGLTDQTAYFGTDPFNLSALSVDLDEDSNTIPNTELNNGNLLYPDTTYYWRIDSTVTGVGVLTGTTWNFTTESGRAYNPTPADGAVDISNIGTTDLYWDCTVTSGRNFDVYFSSDRSLVETNDPDVRIEDNTPDSEVLDVNTPTPGTVYYWRVNTYYLKTNPPVEVPSDVWQFRTEPYKLIFNTGAGDENYLGQGHIIPSLHCHVKMGNIWGDTGVTGSLDSNCGVAIFDFADFNYTSQYDIVVVPDYIPENDNTNGIPTPLAIHVAGNFYFDGMLDISGEGTIQTDSHASPKARCGGHRGARQETNPGDFSPENTLGYYYKKMEFETRYGDERSHWYCVPTVINNVDADKLSGYAVFGPGASKTAPFKGSGGAGYGGIGGDSGRGWAHGIFCGGASYGDKEVPVPFGGSAASWSQHASGGAGGGGIEIVAANIILGSNAQILSNGGTNLWEAASYPSGGGSGGSVKIIAEGNFTNDGIISVNGGKGQDAGYRGVDTAGGGAGGRVAIFYGGTCTPAGGGNISAAGGNKGVVVEGAYSWHNGLGLSGPGQDGTIYVKNFTEADPRKASAPTPRNDDDLVYDDGSHQVTLKWYSGFGSTTSDQVYFGIVDGPNTPLGSSQIPTRGQHTCDVNATVVPGNSYYWYVITDGTVKSDVWEFSVVDWECNEPDWNTYTGQNLNPADANMMMAAGWPAWDFNHDCVVNNEDLWHFAQYWQINRGGIEYVIDITNLEIFVFQWMTCRARTNDGCNGWQPCDDWIPLGDSGL